MGQRLNIEITKGEKVLANAYYHWAGYTSSGLELAQLIVSRLEEVQHENDVVRAIKLLECTGSGLTPDELEHMKGLLGDDFEGLELRPALDRNNGLTAVTEKGMETTRYWEEARMEIDLTGETVAASVFWSRDPEDFDEDEDEKEDEFITTNLDISKIPFAEYDAFCESVFKAIKDGIYRIKLEEDDTVLGFIE